VRIELNPVKWFRSSTTITAAPETQVTKQADAQLRPLVPAPIIGRTDLDAVAAAIASAEPFILKQSTPAKAEENTMGFIQDVKSEIGKAEKALASWWGKEPKLANVVGIGVNIAGAALETVFTIEGNGPASTLVGDVVSKAQQELLAVNTLVTNVGTMPTAKGILQGVVSDISALEAAASIKDPKSISAIGLAVNTINSLVNAIPVATAAPVAGALKPAA
jgi:hypothetical protein